MSSLIYLMMTTFKNQLKEIVKSPMKLIPYALAIGFIVFTLITSALTDMPAEPTDTLFLKGIFFAFFMLTLVSCVVVGLKGASPYSMEDVNLLFSSPIKARAILLFGIIKAIKPILLGSWFVFFQAGWFRGSFGIGFAGFMSVWIGYVLFSFVSQLLQIFIYAFTHDSQTKKRAAAAIVVLCFVPLVIDSAVHFINADFVPMDTLRAVLGSSAIDYTPFIGWAAYGTASMATGNIASAAIFMGLVLAFGAVLFSILYLKDPDFYEHAAGATQSAYETHRDAMEGDVQSVLALRENIKVRGVGLFGFTGARAFFGKHLRESLRAGRFGLWGLPSFAIVLGAGVLTYINLNADASSHGWNLVAVVMALIGIKYFSSGLGRGYLETFSHYIYMIPESPMQKWLWANGEHMAKVAGESVVIFTVAGVMARENPVAVIVAMVLYVSFTFYMLAVNLAFMRFTGLLYRSPVLAVVFMFLYIIPAIPGIVLAVLAGIYAPEAWALVIGGAVLVWWLLVCGFMLFMASKSILHNCDIPSYMLNSLEQSKL